MRNNNLSRKAQVIISALLIFLIVSVAFNTVLFNRAKQYYIDLNSVRLDPLGLSNYSISDQSPSTSGKPLVVFYGDSRAARWPAPALDDRFDFVNRGIEGQTTEQVLLGFEYHLAPVHPQMVILQVGVNDLKTIPLFPDRKAAIIAKCEENIRQIIQRSNELGATVIVSTIFPVGNPPVERQPFWSTDIAAAIGEVNQYIRSLAQSKVIVFEADSVLADGGQLKPKYALDELHLNEQGYQALNEELTRILLGIN